MVKKCKYCGNVFEGRKQSKFCSRSCSVYYQHKNPVLVKIKCSNCGDEIIVEKIVAKRQKYCKRCYQTAYRNTEKTKKRCIEYSRKQKEARRIARKNKIIICKDCGEKITRGGIRRKYCDKCRKKRDRERVKRGHIQECEFCGIEYKAIVYRSKYCSRHCSGLSSATKRDWIKEIECAYCGKRFNTTNMATGATATKFCSHSCFASFEWRNNPKAKERNERYRLRKMIKSNASSAIFYKKCEVCGSDFISKKQYIFSCKKHRGKVFFQQREVNKIKDGYVAFLINASLKSAGLKPVEKNKIPHDIINAKREQITLNRTIKKARGKINGAT